MKIPMQLVPSEILKYMNFNLELPQNICDMIKGNESDVADIFF